MKKILYFYSVVSPYSYLGTKKLLEISKKYSAEIIEKPVNLVEKVFPATGGVPVPQRHISRQLYRNVELDRWTSHLNIKFNKKPKFWPPKDPHTPAYFLIASIEMAKKMDFILLICKVNLEIRCTVQLMVTTQRIHLENKT